MPEALLEVDDLHAYYGKSHILRGVSFRVHAGEIVSLIGRNGVGRSTTVKALMGGQELLANGLPKPHMPGGPRRRVISGPFCA